MRRGKKRKSLSAPVTRGTWGGRRPGAGRKPKGPRPIEPHRARPKHEPGHPVLVTLHASLGSLRDDATQNAIGRAISGSGAWDPDGFRVLRFFVQPAAVHLLVEADGKRTLSGGVRSVAIRIARGVNALLGRKGRFWADRWHGQALASPREVRRALARVLALAQTEASRARGERPHRIRPAER